MAADHAVHAEGLVKNYGRVRALAGLDLDVTEGTLLALLGPAADQWGHGYATEAARAALSYGFDTLGLDEIVSFTAAINVRSRRVMGRLGMRRDAGGDFGHPNVPEDHPTRAHVLYRIRRGDRT